ncbi:MAG: hypothetical protein WBV43_13595 [Pseudolabrys sp.]
MNSKVGKIDKYVWPNSCHQLVFGHQLTWPFDQGKQNVHGATTERDRFVAFKEEVL